MTQSQREVAHFGGWENKGVVISDTGDGVREWGDPLVRNVEITPQYDSIAGSVILRLPEESRATVGAEYNVFAYNEDNSKATSLNVTDSEGIIVKQMDPGGFADKGMAMTFMNTGDGWIVSSAPSVSGVLDGMQYERSSEEFPAIFDEVSFNRNMASIDAHELAVSRGYSGSDNFRMVIKCSNMTVGSSNPNADSYAFSTGQGWGANCSVVLELDNSTVAGWGGAGADSNGLTTVPPGDGRDAIHAYTDLIVSANGTSKLTAGGSGGSNEAGPSDCGGGGNGGNMTSSGALTPSRGGTVLIVYPQGSLAGSPGEPGRITVGGAGYEDGASWGGDSGIPPSALGFGGLGGNIANTPSGGSVRISWALSDGFTYGENGLPEIVGSGTGHDIDFINAFDPPSFARTGNSGPNLEVGSIIEITGTYSNGTWVPSFYEANLWEVTAHFSAAEGSPNEQFEIKSYPDGDPLLAGEAGSGTNPSSGTLRFVNVTSSVLGPTISSTL